MKIQIQRKFDINLEELLENLTINEVRKLISNVFDDNGDLDELIGALKEELKYRTRIEKLGF